MINNGPKFENMRGKLCVCVWKYAHGKNGLIISDFIAKGMGLVQHIDKII